MAATASPPRLEEVQASKGHGAASNVLVLETKQQKMSKKLAKTTPISLWFMRNDTYVTCNAYNYLFHYEAMRNDEK